MPVSRRTRLVFWMMLAALLLAPAAGAEIYLRSLGLGDPILFYTNDTYRYAPQPNQRQSRWRGAEVTIDSKGLRGVEDWTTRADVKILFVGDSVTWAGTYIGDKDTFAHGVCERLEQTTGRSFVCGNAGVNQYGTDNMAARIRARGINDESILVVTLISHDTLRGLAGPEGFFHATERPPPPFRAVWEAGSYVAWRTAQYFRGHESIKDPGIPDRSLDNLFAAIRETQRPDRKVLIVHSPLENELNAPPNALTLRVRSRLAGSGFDILDLYPDMAAANAKDFYYDGVHLDVAGHRLYADRIAARLQAFVVGPAQSSK
jgi:hypothetical protein